MVRLHKIPHVMLPLTNHFNPTELLKTFPIPVVTVTKNGLQVGKWIEEPWKAFHFVPIILVFCFNKKTSRHLNSDN